jgi:ubiquinone/menaquinone biosynthesis C-methylase UbiE
MTVIRFCYDPGMRVLDLGCGPGSITLGLAQAVAPGEGIGVDLQPSQVAQATAEPNSFTKQKITPHSSGL